MFCAGWLSAIEFGCAGLKYLDSPSNVQGLRHLGQ
jgi:hypothetical protein